jgi:long-chain acyl-CoA synthetase
VADSAPQEPPKLVDSGPCRDTLRGMAAVSESSSAPEAPAADRRGANAVDIFLERVADSGDNVALWRKVGGDWKSSSWNDWGRAAREIAGGLRALGVATGDAVVVLANTRAEWVECDLGILQAGAITVPIYPSNTPEQCEYIISDCGGTYIVVEDPHQLEKLYDPEVRSKLAGLTKIIYMTDVARLEKPDDQGRTSPQLDEVLPDDADRDKLISLDELRARGRDWLEANAGKLDQIRDEIDPEQAATYIYTSGTTGPPKGVILTHANLAFECRALRDLLGLGADDRQLLFLPLAHSFAKVLEWAAISVGFQTAFAESIGQLVPNMQEMHPTFMGAVPRVYEKAYVKIQANFEHKRKKLLSRLIIDWAVKKGQQRSRLLQDGKSATGFGYRMADKLVFNKVAATFGGNIRFFVSGGAPLSREIAEFFHAAGILILEGYGLTETTAATHVNRPDDFAFGTVGPALPGVEVEIAPDGEILVRGGNVMKGYFGQPEATAEVLEDDGWFHTGDIGVIEDGKLKITDRKKDIIVTAGGKNVAPQNIEGHLKAICPHVSQVMVYGDKRKFLTALITLSEENLAEWAAERGLADKSLAELSEEPAVRELVQSHIDALNEDLASYETIKKFEILPYDFGQESGELTPTLKVKRKFCTEKYWDILDGFYPKDDRSSL